MYYITFKKLTNHRYNDQTIQTTKNIGIINDRSSRKKMNTLTTLKKIIFSVFENFREINNFVRAKGRNSYFRSTYERKLNITKK